MMASEEARANELRQAQARAEALFREIEAGRLIRPGLMESELNAAIYQLARQMYGISTYWHKRIVRAGKNTLLPYKEDPPDLTIQRDDILFLDFGPVFEEWEADFGRTYVLGSDPVKHRLCRDVGEAFRAGKRYFEEHAEITGSQLFAYAQQLAAERGWEFGGPIAGHLIGHFPHEKISGDKVSLYIHPESHSPLRSRDAEGNRRHWILEIHFVDRKREIGGFYEELLTVD